MLFSRYGEFVNTLMKMDYEVGYEYIMTALDQAQEEKIWNRWIAGFQKEYSFDEFKSMLTVNKTQTTNTDMGIDEIMDKVKNIIDGV